VHVASSTTVARHLLPTLISNPSFIIPPPQCKAPRISDVNSSSNPPGRDEERDEVVRKEKEKKVAA
jgi:hypothetical protein